MTITAAATEIKYAGNGVTKAFVVPFPFDTAADLKVLVTDEDGNPAHVTTGLSVSGGGGEPGAVTFSVAPDDGVTITIIDDPEPTQPTDYGDNDAFPAESHERALDRVTRLVKRLRQQVGRSLRTPDGDPVADLELGSVEARRGKYLFFNAVTGAIEYAVNLATTALSQSIIAQLLNPQTPEEAAAGVTPVDFTVPDHRDGVVRLARYQVNSDPGVTPHDDALTAALAVIQQMQNKSAVLELPPGDVYFANQPEFDIPQWFEQISVVGKGRQITRLIMGTDGLFFSSTTIMLKVGGFTVDCSNANADANGIRFFPWRSEIFDTRLVPPPNSTGAAYLFDNPEGTFDVKVLGPYVGRSVPGQGWFHNVKAVGDIAGNKAVTNLKFQNGYLSGALDAGVNLKGAIDIHFDSTQLESNDGDGYKLEDVANLQHKGAALEDSGGYGVKCVADVRNVRIFGGMFNNDAGDVDDTGLTGSMVVETGGALTIYRGITMYNGAITFGLSGGTNIKVQSGTGAPEGAVTAYPGTIYLSSNGQMYRKRTGSGNTGWKVMASGIASASAADIANIGSAINTTGKVIYDLVYDTTNGRVLVATGGEPGDPWKVVDGSDTVTPV